MELSAAMQFAPPPDFGDTLEGKGYVRFTHSNVIWSGSGYNTCLCNPCTISFFQVTTKNNEIYVRAKHEERQDAFGFVSREFVRRYVLPEGTDASQVTSAVKDGILEIEAPRVIPMSEGPRKIPIAIE